MTPQKRAIDLVLGTCFLVVSLPLTVLLAVVAGLELRCWPFFLQERVGRFGLPITILKIRTLPRHAPRYAAKADIAAFVEYPFTAFLRRRHLDELPQLVLVPLGRLSLVGPRPEMRHLHDSFDAGFAHERTTVAPGCTGLWQIGDGQIGMIREDERWDRFYVRNVNVRLDLWILWKSVLLMSGLGKPIAFDDLPRWTVTSVRTARRPI